jgi:biopolymer transport protein ExbD
MPAIEPGGNGNGRDVNIQLNIVPFIDLMSCLTAFLLVTAVWVDVAQLDVAPAGKARDGMACEDCPPQLSVLVEGNGVWVGVSRLGDHYRIDGRDWDRVADLLVTQKASATFVDRRDIQIAAESTDSSPVVYQDLVRVMDLAVAAGFDDVKITDVRGLAVRPTI